MKNILVILAIIISGLKLSATAQEVTFADKEYYLLDSLDLDQLSDNDRTVLDTCMLIYSLASHDTTRMYALGLVSDNLASEVWHRYQFLQYDMLVELLKEEHPNDVRTYFLKKMGAALNNLGFLYDDKGDIAKALEYYNRSLVLRKESGDILGVSTTQNNIALIYWSQGDLEQALQYFTECLVTEQQQNHDWGIARTLSHLGSVFGEMGNLDTAMYYFIKSLEIEEKLENKSGIARCQNNIGKIHRERGELDQAVECYKLSAALYAAFGDKSGEATALYNMGWISQDLKDMELMKSSAERSLELAMELGYPEDISDPANLMSRVYRHEGKYQQALEMYELHIKMRDSIKNEENQKAAIRQQTKYEFEKKQLLEEQSEKERARLEAEVTARRDNLQYSIVLICLLGIGVLVAMLGKLSLPERVAEGLIFFAFLIFFEFLLVLLDPYIESWSGGAPGFKLLFNAGIAALIFPLHAFFENMLKKRIRR